MVYKSKWGMAVSAENVVQELNRIAEKNGGILDPQEVVNESRPEDAPLHSLFEWDDAIAAEQYRVVQARFIIRNITVEEDDEPTVRQFVHVDGGYVATRKALDDVDMAEALLKQAKADMNAFIAKYRALKSLHELISNMENILQETA